MIEVALIERQTRRKVALSASSAELLRREYSTYISVQPSFGAPGLYDLAAGPYAGSLVLQGEPETLYIHLRPRLPVANLFYLMAYAYRLPLWLPASVPLLHAQSIFEPVVLVFGRWVSDLLRPGLPHGYREAEDRLATVRGHWQVAQDMQRGLAATSLLTCRFSEFTPDTLPNRILRWVITLLANVRYQNPEIVALLRHCLELLGPVSLTPVNADDFERVIFDRLTEPYRPVLNLAHLLLQGLSLDGAKHAEAHATHCAAFLVNMDRLFEGFVAEYLRQHGPRSVAGLSVDIQRSVWLDNESRVRMQPDVLLRHESQPRLVLDTKYKLASADPADLYQVHAYCARLGVPVAWLLYPQPESGPLLAQYTLPACTVYLRTLNLGGSLQELTADCEQLLRAIDVLIR